MLKQFFKKKDGKPILAEGYYIGEGEEEIFDVNEHHYTDIKPPSKLYDPIYFDDESSEWKGNTYEEWVETLPENDEDEEPDPSSIQMAETQMQVAESSFQLRETQDMLAQVMLELAELKGGK